MELDIVRFFRNVDITNDCWLWTGAINHDGYGVFRNKLAHRAIFEHVNGAYPVGTETDHICHNRAICVGGVTCFHRRCVRPDHLEAVTRLVNIQRGRTGLNARIRHVSIGTCQKGHELSDENTYRHTDRRGWVHRRCKICTKERRRADYAASNASHVKQSSGIDR